MIDRWETVRQAILADGPGGYWRLGDSLGSVTAKAEAGAAGTPTGVTFGAAPDATSVDPTTKATFNGTSSRVALPTGLISATNHPSVELWFKTTNPGVLFGYQSTAVGTTPTSYVPALYVGADGQLRGLFWGSGVLSASVIASNGTVTDGKWHHVALTSADSTTTGSTQSLYLDGALVGTRTGQIDTSSMTNNQIGAGFVTNWQSAPGTTGWSYFKGQIADVAVYTSAPSADRVAAHTAAAVATLTQVTSMPAKTFAAVPGRGPGQPAGRTRLGTSQDPSRVPQPGHGTEPDLVDHSDRFPDAGSGHCV